MSLGLALPSRPRAIRVIGSQAKAPALCHGSAPGGCTPPPVGEALWAVALERFVRDEPAVAQDVLEDWLADDGEMHDAHG